MNRPLYLTAEKATRVLNTAHRAVVPADGGQPTCAVPVAALAALQEALMMLAEDNPEIGANVRDLWPAVNRSFHHRPASSAF